MGQFRDRRLEQELPGGGLHLGSSRQIFSDLTAYCGKPIEEIAKAYWQYREGAGIQAQEGVAHATDERPVLGYYQATPHYLYELSYWEGCHDKQMWLRVLAHACARNGFKRVLDYGGGVGGLSIFLHERGIRCDYLDVQGKTADFAAWRFRRKRLSVQTFNLLGGWPGIEYEAVVAWNVLEHVFDLEATIDQIAQHLRRGGWLIGKSTFFDGQTYDQRIHLAKHAKYQEIERFNEMVCGHGFSYQGQLKPNRFSQLVRLAGIGSFVSGTRLSPRLKHGENFLVHERQVRLTYDFV